MPTHNSNDQRPEESHSDGGRNLKLHPISFTDWLVRSKNTDPLNGPVHLAEARTMDLSANNERCTVQSETGVVRPQGFNPADGTLCLDVRLVGKGKVAG